MFSRVRWCNFCVSSNINNPKQVPPYVVLVIYSYSFSLEEIEYPHHTPAQHHSHHATITLYPTLRTDNRSRDSPVANQALQNITMTS